jgi:nucleoside triphosphate diphosphatase
MKTPEEDAAPLGPPTAERGIDRLLAIMARLRDPERGCPWDRAQSFASIAPYTIEEAYEVADAIERRDMAALGEELGDLLLQVVFHARMAEEAGAFDFEQVAGAIADKMVRRHPHVFGEDLLSDAAAQNLAWEAHKAAERAAKGSGSPSGALDGVATALPALLRALKLQRRAARTGFDWPDRAPIFDKIAEEIAELKAELDAGAPAERLEDELGDLLFAVVNLARHIEVEPESALRRANAKFERRFRRIEAVLRSRGKAPEQATLAEMDALWDQAKLEEKSAL